MELHGINLAWIVVKDFEKSVKFYTEVLGLKLLSKTPEYKWAELQGKDGAMMGIAEESEHSPLKAGSHAVLCYTVKNMEDAIEHLKNKGVKLLGELQVIPDHVKLQLFEDLDGNFGQLCELLEA